MSGNRTLSFEVVVTRLLVCLLLLSGSGCLILPPSTFPGDDGRVSLFLDLDPGTTNATIYTGSYGDLNNLGGTVRVIYRVGDEPPVERLVTWDRDSANRIRQGGFNFLFLNRPLSEFDLIGRLIPGGTEVSVRIIETTRSASISFKVDGNVKLRLRMLNPALYGELSDWVLERLL